ncbi:MAG: hypothetical protein RLZZ141_1905 [Pseudomonadota bacterium]|jgi:hypothetical protein
MIIFVSVLLLGFIGGFAIGATAFGLWRRRLLLVWAALPLAAYLLAFVGMLISGGVQSASVNLSQDFSWFLIGLLGFVGLPMLLFAGSSVLGYFLAPAPKRAWRLKNWRLPQ